MVFFEVLPMKSNAQVRCAEIPTNQSLGKHRDNYPKQKALKYDSLESKMNFKSNKLCKEEKGVRFFY